MAINSHVRCCVAPLHRFSPSCSLPLAPTCNPFPLREAPSLGLFLVRSQASSSEGLGSPNTLINSEYSHNSIGSSTSSSCVINFVTLCNRLKTTKRKGWANHGIKGGESIADHMYHMSLMALIAGDVPGLCRERCIKMALIHDIAEAIVGDITPSDGVPKPEKSRMEQEALNKMCEVLGGGMRAEEIKELWTEYENNSSIEANLVKDFDKVLFNGGTDNKLLWTS